MEYVEGRSLRTWLKQRGKLGLGSTVRILCLLCDALEHAHQFTIHRDLSPDNVMVLRDGSIKLLDFGLAKLMETDAQLTMVGVNLGKRQYNAPEQQLNAKGVDKRADLYSVGVMFYEMLTGDIPNPLDFTPLTQLRPDLPKSCDAFLDTAMAKFPEDRHSSAKEMSKALLKIFEESKNADPPEEPGDARRGARGTSRETDIVIQDTPEETAAPSSARRRGLWSRLAALGRRIFRRRP
jgi:serine/threonine-protein kinase